MLLKKFNTAFSKAINLINEQAEALPEGVKLADVQHLESKFELRGDKFKYAKNFRTEFANAVAATKKVLDAAKGKSTKVEITDNGEPLVATIKSQAAFDAWMNKHQTYRPSNYDYLAKFERTDLTWGKQDIPISLGDWILPEEYSRLKDLVEAGVKNSQESDAALAAEEKKFSSRIRTPEFKAFLEKIKKAGFEGALGSDAMNRIGGSVPDEFFTFFKEQSREDKLTFIQYVREFKTSDGGFEYADGPQYSRDIDNAKENDRAKKQYIEKLEANL